MATTDGASAEVWATKVGADTPTSATPRGPRIECTYHQAAGNLNSFAVGETATAMQPGDVVIRVCRNTDTGATTSGPDIVTISEPADINPLPGLIDRARASLTLPRPDIQISPPGGETLPNIRTWFWASTSTTTSGASGNAVSVTITAEPVDVTFTAGDQTVICPDGGTPYDTRRSDTTQQTDCALVFRPPTRQLTVTARSTWRLRWSASTGESGDLGTTTTTATAPLTVVEYATAIRDR